MAAADTPEGGRGKGEGGRRGEEGERAWSVRIGSKGRNMCGEMYYK